MEAQSLSYDRCLFQLSPEKQHTTMFFITFYTVELQHSTFRHQSMSSQNLSEGHLLPSQPHLLICPFCKPYSITGPCSGQCGIRMATFTDPTWKSF